MGKSGGKTGNSNCRCRGIIVTVDDSADTTSHNVTIDAPPPGDPSYPFTIVNGLTQFPITWNFTGGGSAQVSILGGLGNDSFVVQSAISDVALSIDGGAGRDLLVAGQSQVALAGGAGEDILIGSWTDYDNISAAIALIMAEWARTDIGYDARVSNLLHGAAGVAALNVQTVHGNDNSSNINGGTERDLFIVSVGSILFDWNSLTETRIDV